MVGLIVIKWILYSLQDEVQKFYSEYYYISLMEQNESLTYKSPLLLQEYVYPYQNTSVAGKWRRNKLNCLLSLYKVGV